MTFVCKLHSHLFPHRVYAGTQAHKSHRKVKQTLKFVALEHIWAPYVENVAELLELW